MTIDQFLKQYENKSWDFDGMYGNQCFDLFQFYNRDVVGAPFVTGASAKDIWNAYPRAFYEQIANGPTNFPVRGDVVIWGDKYGPYGHVAICTEGDVNKFTCLSQNDPAGVPSIYKTYTDWKGVLGWIRPKPPQEDPLQACLRQHADLITQIDNLNRTLGLTKQDNETKLAMIKDLENNLSASNSKLKPLQERVAKLEAYVQSIKELTAKV